MGKSNQNFDKGAPRRRVNDDEVEDFDWKEAVRKAEEEFKEEIQDDINLESYGDEDGDNEEE